MTVVWERMSAAERDAYERETGTKPPGYRGTGRVEWFQQHHPDEAPCVHCQAVTDRFEIRDTYIGTVAWGGATYKGHALCGVMVAVCESCERTAAIATLRKRQPLGLASEAMYLAELETEALEAAA